VQLVFLRRREKRDKIKNKKFSDPNQYIKPLHAPPHRQEDVMSFLTPSWMVNFHHLAPLHALLEALEMI